ncbi:hypothetical protein BAURA86_02695 [Brevibacterium aurantiacum]|uniref:Uncharacterized protein n=1 Tax=Brevibacterium aurantiacum TaxID=273384 RepID=A0A2H1KDR1_BREAU|nr:hypothetical protein [Brevibacterium aurantiacum]SMX97947.1 hypothetical protein BAURA86_02695 [Brevibacterium aurantiacum]
MTQFPLWVQRANEHAGLIDPKISTRNGKITISDNTGRTVLFTGTSLRETTPLAA